MLNSQERPNTKEHFNQLRKALKQMAEQTTAEELSEMLSLMLDTFITQSECDDITKANAATTVLKITKIAFLSERIIKEDQKNKQKPVSLKKLAIRN